MTGNYRDLPHHSQPPQSRDVKFPPAWRGGTKLKGKDMPAVWGFLQKQTNWSFIYTIGIYKELAQVTEGRGVSLFSWQAGGPGELVVLIPVQVQEDRNVPAQK